MQSDAGVGGGVENRDQRQSEPRKHGQTIKTSKKIKGM